LRTKPAPVSQIDWRVEPLAEGGSAYCIPTAKARAAGDQRSRELEMVA